MTPRKKILAGNWKMNLGPKEALEYFISLKKELKTQTPSENTSWVIFPPAYALTSEIQKQATTTSVQLGAQNVHWEIQGAYTGELSAMALKSMGIDWTLIAHSERRQHFGETDETASRRLKCAASLGLNIIYCIGESLFERESGKMEPVLKYQTSAFTNILKSLEPSQISHCALAYEPVWAIGTGKTATPGQASFAHSFIRTELAKSLGLPVASTISILYGGSVTPENAKTLLLQPDIDGVLVGGASLRPESFSKILHL